MPVSITRRLLFGLLCAVLALFAVHCAVTLSWRLSHSVAPHVLALLDMTSETSLFSWLSVMTWALLGMVCFVWAGLGQKVQWVLTGSLFLFLSTDDACMLHELSGYLVVDATRDIGVYPWLFVLGPVFAALGVLVFVHLWKSVGPFPGGRLSLALGFGCLAFAILLEILEGPLTRSGWRWRGMMAYSYTQPVEELFEYLGPLFLLHAVGAPLEVHLREAHAAPAS